MSEYVRETTLSERLQKIRELNARKNKLQNVVDALIASGHSSLDQQARALGLHRATVWTITKHKHKLGRLSTKTLARIISNPDTPPLVLTAIHEYVTENHQCGSFECNAPSTPMHRSLVRAE